MPKNTKIGFDRDSLKEVLTEIWNDANDVKAKAGRQFNVYKNEIDDKDDITNFGRVINDTLKIIDTVNEKKVSIAKIIHNVIIKDATIDDQTQSGSSTILSAEDKLALQDMIKSMEKNAK